MTVTLWGAYYTNNNTIYYTNNNTIYYTNNNTTYYTNNNTTYYTNNNTIYYTNSNTIYYTNNNTTYYTNNNTILTILTINNRARLTGFRYGVQDSGNRFWKSITVQSLVLQLDFFCKVAYVTLTYALNCRHNSIDLLLLESIGNACTLFIQRRDKHFLHFLWHTTA